MNHAAFSKTKEIRLSLAQPASGRGTRRGGAGAADTARETRPAQAQAAPALRQRLPSAPWPASDAVAACIERTPAKSVDARTLTASPVDRSAARTVRAQCPPPGLGRGFGYGIAAGCCPLPRRGRAAVRREGIRQGTGPSVPAGGGQARAPARREAPPLFNQVNDPPSASPRPSMHSPLRVRQTGHRIKRFGLFNQLKGFTMKRKAFVFFYPSMKFVRQRPDVSHSNDIRRYPSTSFAMLNYTFCELETPDTLFVRPPVSPGKPVEQTPDFTSGNSSGPQPSRSQNQPSRKTIVDARNRPGAHGGVDLESLPVNLSATQSIWINDSARHQRPFRTPPPDAG